MCTGCDASKLVRYAHRLTRRSIVPGQNVLGPRDGGADRRYVLLIIGLRLGAHLAHVPEKWIGVGVLCLVGLAIMHGVTATRHKDPPS
jgi:hypothetical protein